MVLSSLYILDLKGKLILSRDYRGDVPAKTYEKFVPLVLEQDAINVIQGDGMTQYTSVFNDVEHQHLGAGSNPLAATVGETSENWAPILWHEGVGYVYVKVNNLYCK